MDYSTYQVTVVSALQDLYARIVAYLPNLVVAIIVLIIGWLLAMFLSKLVRRILDMIKIDQLANQLGMQNLSEKVERKLSLAALGGWVIKWFFFLGSFLAAADILGLPGVSAFLYEDVLTYAGRVVLAMAFMLLGILAANFFSGLVNSAVKASGLHRGGILGSITQWAIIVFTFFTVLSKLGVGDYLQDLYRAIIAMLAIAGGLAFGLGGKETAKKILDDIEAGFKP